MKSRAEDIVELLIKNNYIQESVKDTYVYAVEIWLEKVLSLMTILIISVVMGKVLETILFLIFFMMLRRYTCGYHAKSFLHCYMESMILMSAILYAGKYYIAYFKFIKIILFISIIVIMIVGTIDHPNMNYMDGELDNAKEAARYTALLELIAFATLDYLGAPRKYISFMALGMIACAISIILAKITKQESA